MKPDKGQPVKRKPIMGLVAYADGHVTKGGGKKKAEEKKP